MSTHAAGDTPVLARALEALVAMHAPEWRLTAPSARVQREAGGAVVVELRGALPQTMHFGSARVHLQDGLLVLVDEDHRDGGDVEVLRVTLDAVALASVRAALEGDPGALRALPRSSGR